MIILGPKNVKTGFLPGLCYTVFMAILGIDEVGRGPWAGPLVVGACILPDEQAEWVEQLADSKKLSDKRRRELSEIIKCRAATATGWVAAEELGRIGQMPALQLATRRAVQKIREQKVAFHHVVIDGNINFLEGTSLEKYVTTIVKADDAVKAVSAASIVAKVTRDQYMVEIAEKYPGYGFERHVGYGTKLHARMLEELGACPEHRRNVRPVRERLGLPPLPQAGKKGPRKEVALRAQENGRRAEEAVAKWLAMAGHEIVERNHKTRLYEIDIVSVKDGKVYFTEVKYRQDRRHGSPLEMVTRAKQEQMRFAAKAYLKFKKAAFADLQPMLAVGAVVGREFQVEEWLEIQ